MSDSRLFWIEPGSGRQITYGRLLGDLTSRTTVSTVLDSSDPYELWTGLIASILARIPITLIDSDLSRGEEAYVGLRRDATAHAAVETHSLASPERLIEAIRACTNDWRLELFSSGTTGRPKSVRHTLASLSRGVRVGPSHCHDVWAFAYRPSHFAGLQVFLQALMNLNPMVYVFDLPADGVVRAVADHGITHISATPTFYRTRLLDSAAPLHSVRRVTVGGERSDLALIQRLQSAFPQAALRNIYASTEAGALLAADGEYFRIPDALASLVRVSEEGELLLHRDLLAVDWPVEWFGTGDLVDTPDGVRFRFIGRATEMINVGGYKVNPHEVEEAIRTVDGVADATVTSQPNSVTGAVLVANIRASVHNLTDRELERVIRSRLREVLQPHKVPRVFRFVEELASSRTGKVKRS